VGPRPEFIARVTERQAVLRTKLAGLIPLTAAITLELGSGHGHFLTRYATEFPHRLCLGVDLISDRIRRSKRKAERAKLAHCHFVQAEARELIDALPAGGIAGLLPIIVVIFLIYQMVQQTDKAVGKGTPKPAPTPAPTPEKK